MEAMTFWRTTVGKKMAMAVTGVVMILFLVAHVAGNLLVFRGPVQLDAYSVFLKHEAVALWTVRLVLLAAVVLHVIAAYQLARNDRAARLKPYVHVQPRAADTLVADDACRRHRHRGLRHLPPAPPHYRHHSACALRTLRDVYDERVSGGFRIWWVVGNLLHRATPRLAFTSIHGAW